MRLGSVPWGVRVTADSFMNDCQSDPALKDSATTADESRMDLAQAQRMDLLMLRRPGHRKRRFGGFLMAASPIVMTVALLTSALTINPCGAIGESCDDFGHSTALGEVALYVAFGSAVTFFVGLMLLMIGAMQRH